MGKYRIYGIASGRLCLSPYQIHMKPECDIHNLYAEAIAAETNSGKRYTSIAKMFAENLLTTL